MNGVQRGAIFLLLLAAAGAGMWLGTGSQIERKALPDKGSTVVAPAAPVAGQRRPDFELKDLDGVPRAVSEWDGKVLVLNFWGTWCPPCLKEIPEFVELQQRLGERGLQFVGIALEKPEAVREFADRHGMNYPNLAGGMDVIAVAEAYGNEVGALPYTVIIDRAGTIVFTRAGALPGPDAEKLILPLL
jgi:peroxiredoxin